MDILNNIKTIIKNNKNYILVGVSMLIGYRFGINRGVELTEKKIDKTLLQMPNSIDEFEAIYGRKEKD